MIDKKVVIAVLLVLVTVFVVVLLFACKQWKHLPWLNIENEAKPSIKPQTVTLLPRQKKSGNKTRPFLQVVPPKAAAPKVDLNPEVCYKTSQPPKGENKGNNDNTTLEVSEANVLQASDNKPINSPDYECSPLTTFAPRVEREYELLADSALRDYATYPNAQMYYFRFPSPLFNVQSIDIVQAIIPKSDFQVNVSNQTFFIQEGTSVPVSVNLTVGNYASVALLAVEITLQINSVGLANTYTVTETAGKLVFTRTAGVLPFSLLFTVEFDPYGVVRQLLGFPPIVANDDMGLLLAPYRSNLDGIQYIDIVAPEVTKYLYDSPVLARIPLTGGTSSITEYDPQNSTNRKFWPIQRLNGLTLQFFQGPTSPPQSLLYNLEGLETALMIKVTCFEYKNIFIDEFCIEQMV